jgi:hypothetical protein
MALDADLAARTYWRSLGSVTVPRQEYVALWGTLLPKLIGGDSAKLDLPHDQHPFLGPDNPLHTMVSETLTVFRQNPKNRVVYVGSSGCGKTTAALMVAKQRYCIYFEAKLNSWTTLRGHHLLASELCKSKNGSAAWYATVARRVWQSVAVRAFVLAALVKSGIVKSPYEWLLLSVSDRLVDLIRTACQVFDMIERMDYIAVLQCCSSVIGCAPIVIVDDATLLGMTQQRFDTGGAFGTGTIDLWSCVSNSLRCLSVGGIVEVGTEMRTEHIRTVASFVKKASDDEGASYAIGCFPVVSYDAALASLLTIRPKEQWEVPVESIAYWLQGRPRFFANFLEFAYNNQCQPLAAVLEKYRSDMRSIVSEFRRTKISQEALVGLWHDFLVDRSPKAAALELLGTVACTRRIVSPDSFGNARCGGELRTRCFSGETEGLEFEYDVMEPLLVAAIEAQLEQSEMGKWQSLGNGAPADALDYAVLKRAKEVCRGENMVLSAWLGPEMSSFGSFCVKRVAGGVGMFNLWLRAVLERPDEVFEGLCEARYVAVRPETDAGAGWAFASFDSSGTWIVTGAATREKDGVGMQKWEDQCYRSGVLGRQFMKTNPTEPQKPIEPTDPVLISRRETLLEALEHKSYRGNVRMLVELPRRKGLQRTSSSGNVVFVDETNCENILGFAPVKTV